MLVCVFLQLNIHTDCSFTSTSNDLKGWVKVMFFDVSITFFFISRHVWPHGDEGNPLECHFVSPLAHGEALTKENTSSKGTKGIASFLLPRNYLISVSQLNGSIKGQGFLL